MKLFHGSNNEAAPVIKVGTFALGGARDNVFDGIFASAEYEDADSHGRYVHTYEVKSIADNADLNARIDDVIAYLSTEIDECDAEEIEALANAIADDECDDAFSHLISTRLDSDIAGAHSWEMQRLRGRVAAHLGFDAIEMDDEHGISYLIVNPRVIAE